jgi:hypothetical protein
MRISSRVRDDATFTRYRVPIFTLFRFKISQVHKEIDLTRALRSITVVVVGEVKPVYSVFKWETGEIHEDIILPRHSQDGLGISN